MRGRSLVLLSLLFLAGSPLSAQVLYEELFPNTSGSNEPVSNVGWRNDIPANPDRLYSAGAVFSFNGAANTEAFYTTTAFDTGGTGDAFPSINPASFPSLNFSVDLQSQFNPANQDAYFSVLIGGSWYVSAEPLATPGGTFETQSMIFDPTASLWNELTVSGDGTGTGATIGSTPAMDLSGLITGAGMVFDRTASGTHNFDNFTINAFTPNQWNIDGGGSFNTPGNWLEGVVPTDDALFAGALATPANAPAVVSLDAGVSLNSVEFSNSNQYVLAGPQSLTLTGDREVNTGSGTHLITANVLGAAGFVKSGDGTLVLTGAKGYTGTTDVQAGTLEIDDLDALDNQAGSNLNIAAGATVSVVGGVNGTLATQLTGSSTGVDSTLRIGAGAETSDTVTINRSNASYGGVIRADGGTLEVTNNNALGTGGISNNRTVVQAGSTAKLALSGGVTIANEVLDFEGRTTDDAALSSTGNNAWNGVIRGEGGRVLNIESTAGTLTLNSLYAEDTTRIQNYVFSGTGDTTITNRLSDAAIDIDSGIVTVKTEDNVGVVKRGSGTLRIDYATDQENDYWFGPTTIEEGTLTVAASGGTVGELRSSTIDIRAGATLDVSGYTEYTQQIGQSLRGSGSINVGAGNLRLIDVSSVAPGDSPGAVGELTVASGTVTLPDLFLGGGGAWSFDIGNNANASGDLLNVQNGSFTASTSGITVNVTAANGHLDAGSRTIVAHTGGANPMLNSASAQITDASGNPLTTRQSVSINGNTAGQVNVVVTGEEASRTWSGSASGAWDVSTPNWQEGDQQFRDLDHVTFNDTASTTDVTLAENRSPGSVTFANSVDYTFSGDGGIVGSGDINVTGSGQVTLANVGNNFSGATTIDAGSSLRIREASTGSIVNSGSLSLGTVETIDVLVQDGGASIGTGAYKVFAFEAESFQTQVENAAGLSAWTVRSDIAGSSGAGPNGEALYASEDPSNTATSTATQNYVGYNMKFAEPGTYTWFFDMVSTDGGDGNSTPDGDAGNDDSFFAPTDNLSTSNSDPAAIGSRIENFGSGRVNAEASTGDPLAYDWYRNGDGTHANEFRQIEVTQADVDAGTVFSFKVATREGGLTLDKFVFVDSPDFVTDPNFGTLTDADLDAAVSISQTEESFIAAGTVLDVNGDFTMADSGTLNLLLSSANSHDQLDISGTLTADGTLSIGEGGEGFAAAAGDVFDIFRFESAVGAFDSIILPTLEGLAWDTSSLLIDGTLVVVEQSLVPGDFNADGRVDNGDLNLLLGSWGSPTVPAEWVNGFVSPVDNGELNALLGDWGFGTSIAVPEPGASLLFAFAVVGLAWGRPRC